MNAEPPLWADCRRNQLVLAGSRSVGIVRDDTRPIADVWTKRENYRKADEGRRLEVDMRVHSNLSWATARLKLRRARADDVTDVLAYASDPVVTRFTDWPAVTHLHQVAHVVQGWQRDWESGTEFTWVVTDSQADRAIGAVSYSRTGSEATFGYET